MNGRERFLAALAGRPVDRPPLAHVAALTSVQLQETTGCWMPDVHHHAEQLARLMAANHERLGFDAVSFLINYFNEPAALGVHIDWGAPDRLPVFTSHPWRTPSDVPEDVSVTALVPVTTCLETLRMAKRDYGDRIAVLGKVMGPLSMVQVMHGVEATMVAAIENPEMIREFLEIVTPLLIECANAQLDVGADAVSIGEGGAGSKMLSPRMYEDLLLPFHQRVAQRINGPTIFHMCGDMLSRAPLLGQIGMTCFNFDWAVAPDDMAAAAGDAYTLMGNINTTDLLHGNPDQLQQQVQQCLEAGIQIISPGCAVSPNCPIENLRSLRRAIDASY